MAADKNFESHVSEEGTVISGRLIPEKSVNSLEYADILKFSNCHNITVTGCTIEGGIEDCIDAVRGKNYVITDCTLCPLHTGNGVTLKGSIDGALLDRVTFTGHGKDCDIDIGQFDNYWYIGRPPTRGISIYDTFAADKNPVIVRLWDAETPTVYTSNVKIVRIPKFIWWPYFVFRAIQTRGIKNIFKPVSEDTFIKTN